MQKKYANELNIKELSALPDSAIDTSDIPELDEEFWKNAELIEPPTTAVSLRVKTPVLNAFKATGKGYQKRMNAVLEAYARTLHK